MNLQEYRSIYGPNATLDGEPFGDDRAILVKYTLAGDSNFDGSADLTDFTYMATDFNKPADATWLEGDYNYDGRVDLTDLTFLASNFNQQLPSEAALQAPQVSTPLEPASRQ